MVPVLLATMANIPLLEQRPQVNAQLVINSPDVIISVLPTLYNAQNVKQIIT